MLMDLCLVWILASSFISEVFSHVILTFPSARTYQFDYLDSYRNSPPCGMAKTQGAPATSLVAGSEINITWHLAFPHLGGSKIELIKEQSGRNFEVVATLTPGNGFHFQEDTVKRFAVVSLPNEECLDCAIRLIRQGAEYSPTYQFWSCADVSIIKCTQIAPTRPVVELMRSAWVNALVKALDPANGGKDAAAHTRLLGALKSINVKLEPAPDPVQGPVCTPAKPGCFDGYCLNGGTCDSATGKCQCNRLFSGERCMYKDECWTDEDCNYHGQCIDTRATTPPVLQCYCERGWFGAECDKESEITEIRSDYATNSSYMSRELLKDEAYLYWTYVKDLSEIEIIMRIRTHSWIGIGWKSVSTRSTCKNLDPVLEVEKKHAEAQRQLLQRQASYTTTGSTPHRDPEIDIENSIGSNLEKKCGRNKRKKRHTKRVRRQSGFPLYRGMDCADITVASVKGNLIRIRDTWTPDCSIPTSDTYFGGTDDITSAYGTQVNEFTTIAFRKKVAANHFTDHAPNNGEQLVIWARGQEVDSYSHSPPGGLEQCKASDLRFYRHDELKYHGLGGSRRPNGRARLSFSTSRSAALQAGTTTEAPCSESGDFKSPTDCSSDDSGFNCVYFVAWRHDNDVITFTLKAKQESGRYLALGISNDVMMPMTDIYSAYLDSAGQPVIEDRFATDRSKPVPDLHQNVTSISGNYNNGVSMYEFSRPRASTIPSDFGFDECRHLMFAEGPITNGDIAYHLTRTVITPEKLCIKPCGF